MDNRITNFNNSISEFLKSHKNTPCYIRANEYNDEKIIKNITVNLQQNTIQAKIKGTSTYKTSLKLDNKKMIIHSYCSCPTEDLVCKHTLALAMFCRHNITNLIEEQSERQKEENNLLIQKALNLPKQDLQILLDKILEKLKK